MKYQTAKYADGIFTVNCPHCSNEVAVDESQLEQINTQLAGQYACPIEGCGKDIGFPNAEEAAGLKAPTSPAAPAPQEVAAAPASEPAPAPTSKSAPAPVAQESEPTPAPEPVPAPAPAPPPQTNPAAKSTQPPAKAPASAPKSATPPSPPASQPQTKDADSDFDFGFHGSKGASLEREAATAQRISMKTILHGDCLKDTKDTFDETVTRFLHDLDEECLMGVHPVQYTVDEKKGTDFGVMILYKIVADED